MPAGFVGVTADGPALEFHHPRLSPGGRIRFEADIQAESLGAYSLQELVGKLQKPQRIGDMDAALAYGSRDVVMSVFEVARQRLVALGLFERDYRDVVRRLELGLLRDGVGVLADGVEVAVDRDPAFLVEGPLGFEPLLSHNLQAPIIVTFRMPADPKFRFQEFYDRLKDRGYVIYPGKLTVADSFRIGCIGRLYPDHMRGALAAIRDILDEMGVKSLKAAA